MARFIYVCCVKGIDACPSSDMERRMALRTTSPFLGAFFSMFYCASRDCIHWSMHGISLLALLPNLHTQGFVVAITCESITILSIPIVDISSPYKLRQAVRTPCFKIPRLGITSVGRCPRSWNYSSCAPIESFQFRRRNYCRIVRSKYGNWLNLVWVCKWKPAIIAFNDISDNKIDFAKTLV